MLHIEIDRSTQRHEHPVCGDRGLRDHRMTHGTQRTRAGQFGEEDVALVLAHDPHAFLRMCPQPFDNALHIGLAVGEQPAFTHHPADTGIIMAVLPGIADPHDRAVGERQSAAALYLQKEKFDIILSPGNLEPLTGDGAVVNGRPVFIRYQFSALDLAADALVFQLFGKQTQIDIDQIGRPPVDGHCIIAVSDSRPANLRFEIASREGRAIADLDGFEIGCEETCRIIGRPVLGSIARHLPIGTIGQTAIIFPPDQRGTAGAKRVEGRRRFGLRKIERRNIRPGSNTGAQCTGRIIADFYKLSRLDGLKAAARIVDYGRTLARPDHALLRGWPTLCRPLRDDRHRTGTKQRQRAKKRSDFHDAVP